MINIKFVGEPKNVDLVVGPSILTDDTKNKIALAIAHYKETGKKPVSVKNAADSPAKRTKRPKSAAAHF